MEGYVDEQICDNKNTVKCSLWNLGNGNMGVHRMILPTFSQVGLEKYKKEKRAPDMRWMRVPYDHWMGERGQGRLGKHFSSIKRTNLFLEPK